MVQSSSLGAIQLLEACGDVIFTLDAAGYITYINARVQPLLGYATDEMIGQHYERFVAPLWTEHLRSIYQRVYRNQDRQTLLEVPLINRQGQEIWGEQMIAPLIDDDGVTQGLVVVMRDLGERSPAENELEKRISQMVTLQRIDAELTHKLDMRYVLSMALDEALRLSNADAGGLELFRDGNLYMGTIIGNYPSGYLYDYPRPPSGVVARALRERRPELIVDVRQDPDYIPVIETTRAMMVIPLLSQDRLLGVLFLETRRPERFTAETFDFIQLITTRIAAAMDNAQLFDTTRQQLAELQKLYTQISSLEQLKTDMIRIAAHDLGNPLTSITGFIDLLLESEMSDKQREQAQLIKDSALRMKKIIRDILSLQRIEQLAQGSLTQTIDLTEVVRQVCETQQYSAVHRQQTFTVELPDYPALIKGDEAQMREAVVNLVSNALKYTPEGGTIQVRLWEEDDTFYFEVEDNGYGVPEAMQARLFQPFFRAKTRETSRIDGTGLGLHLVKNIIERHRGRMRFHSVYQQGSVFGFEIPVPL
jgi:PAS domain S-box-containing protein